MSAALILPAQAQLDTNNTGMSDVWERHFNNGELFDPANPDHHPDADPDGDGWTNLQESIAGTDPFSASPPDGFIPTYITYLKDQEIPDPDDESQTIITDVAIISWDTIPGKTYTLWSSPDLAPNSWIIADGPVMGDGDPWASPILLSNVFEDEPERLFWRVKIEDTHIDSDGDGLTDYEEYLLGSDPHNPVTSGDGVPDGWLVIHGYDPTAHHGDVLFGNSGVTVPAAFDMGVQAHPDATPEDFDGDGVPNELDAHPTDRQINWLRAEVGGYVLIDLGLPENSGSIKDFNDLGHVLTDFSVWRDGGWHDIPQEEFEGTFEIPYIDSEGQEYFDTYHYSANGGAAHRLSPDGGIHMIGEWTASGPGDLEGNLHAMYVPYLPLQDGFGEVVSTLETQDIESTIISYYPYGGNVNGVNIVAKKEHGEDDELWFMNSGLGKTSKLSLPGGLSVGLHSGRVTTNGWLAAYASSASQSQEHQTLVWNPSGAPVGTTGGELPYYFSDISEIHGTHVALVQSHLGDGEVRLLDMAEGVFSPSQSLADKRIRYFAGNGTAITTDHHVWLNGELVEIDDLCPEYQEMRDAGWSLFPYKGNKHGVFLIEAQRGSELAVLKLVPLDFSVFPPEPTDEDLQAAGDDTWEVETFQIAADETEFWVQANVMVPGVDEDGISVMMPAADGTEITWEIDEDSSDTGATLASTTTETENGHTAVLLTTSTIPGDRFKVRGKLTKLVMPGDLPNPVIHENSEGLAEIRTQYFEVVPGNTHSIQLTSDVASVPADEGSFIELYAVFTDEAGNPVARGTDVNWRVSGGGAVRGREHLIAGEDGTAVATLVAGSVVGTQTVTVEADGVVAEIQIENTPVQMVSMAPAATTLDMAAGDTTTVTLQTSGVADGAPVTWKSTKGILISHDTVISNNTAHAVLATTQGTSGTSTVFATVGDGVATCEVTFTSSSVASIEVAQPVIVYDEGSDGSEDVPSLYGPPVSVPYFAETPVTIRAPAHPGEWVSVSFAGRSFAQAFRHGFDEQDGVTSPASNPSYPAVLTGDAAIVDFPRSGPGSLHLPAATSAAGIAHHDALSLSHGSTLSFSIRPDETEGTVFEKSGAYSADFLSDGRLRFTIGSGQDAASVASPAPFEEGVWTDVRISLAAGHLTMHANGSPSSTPLPQSWTASTADLVIGGMTGYFDDLRITHSQQGFDGISIHAIGLNVQGEVLLDGNGEATIIVNAQQVGDGPAGDAIGQAIDIEISVAGQVATATEAITVTSKGTAVLIRAIAGQTAVIGTDTSNLDRAQMAHEFLRRGVREADRAGALPKDLSGDAAARGECGYLIAIWMEETVDEAGEVHSLMHVTAQNLPEEVGEVLNWMLAELMVSAGHRHDSQSFSDYIIRNYRELINALQALSSGDSNTFLAMAGMVDGEESFDDFSVAANQVGDGMMTRIAKTAASEVNNGYELVRAAFNRRNSRIKMASLSDGFANFHHAIRGPILDLMQTGDAGIEAVLRDLSQQLHVAQILTSEDVAAVGALYGFLREGNEIAQELAHPELFAKAIPTLLDILIGAARGDEASLDALKDIGSAIVMGPVNEIPQAAEAWDNAEYFNAGNHYAAAVVGGALVANTFKRSLQRGAYRCVGHGRHLTALAGRRGEALAMARFRAKGYTDIVPIQNSSGHGIDLIMRDRNGGIVAVEVKSHLLAQRPAVQTNMRTFVQSRLTGARNKDGHWRNVDEATRLHAVRYLDEMLLLKRPVRGIVVNIDYALTQFPRERYFEWSKGLGAEIFINNF